MRYHFAPASAPVPAQAALPRRILHVIDSVHPKAGGPSSVITRLSAAQAARGHDVTIFSFLPPESEADFQHASKNIPGFERVRLIFNSTDNSTRWVIRSRNRAELRAAINAADIVHIHGIWKPVLLIAARAAYQCSVPYIVRPCGMLDPWSLGQHALKKRVALAAGYRWMLNHAASLHVLNADERRLIERLALKCEQTIIPNGVFMEEIHPLPPRVIFRAAHPELRDKPFILFLSRLHRKKGLDLLLDAFLRIAARRDVHLVIAGPDDGEGPALAHRIAESGLQSRIHVIGPLYGKEKLAAMADAALFCLPSQQEGFSVATCEALAAGLPAVISEECHFPEVRECGAGRVVPLDAAAMAQAMEEILASPKLRVAMGTQGRRLMETRFTWPAIAGECDTMYSAAMERETPPRRRHFLRRVSIPVLELSRYAFLIF